MLLNKESIQNESETFAVFVLDSTMCVGIRIRRENSRRRCSKDV